MAEKSLAEKKKLLDALSSKFNKNKGKVVVGRLSENPELIDKLKVRFIETPSMNVNAALGGGWPRGRISIVSGNEDSGNLFAVIIQLL